MARRLSASGIILSLLLVACGGSTAEPGENGGTTTPGAQATTTTGGSGTATSTIPDITTPRPSSGSVDGEVVIDGVTHGINEMLRCEPFGDDPDSLDLTAIGQGYTLFIVIEFFVGSPFHELSIQGNAAGGVFSAAASEIGGSWITVDTEETLDGPPFTVSGDRISGAMTLVESFSGNGTLDVSFDVPVPSDIEDCSL
jgi:hypothetical protein